MIALGPNILVGNHTSPQGVLLHGNPSQTCITYRISSIRRHGYYYFAACFMWLLFEGNVYFFGKPGGINDGWIRYVWVRQWRLLDAFSSMRSLSVLVSAMGTTRTTKSPTGLEERDRGFMMCFIFCIKCDCHVVERERDGRVGGQRCSVTSSWRCCLGA